MGGGGGRSRSLGVVRGVSDPGRSVARNEAVERLWGGRDSTQQGGGVVAVLGELLWTKAEVVDAI